MINLREQLLLQDETVEAGNPTIEALGLAGLCLALAQSHLREMMRVNGSNPDTEAALEHIRSALELLHLEELPDQSH